MGWRCCECGKYGDRKGAQVQEQLLDKPANWCVRQGTASMAGINMCCMCKRTLSTTATASGSPKEPARFAFETEACDNCRRLAGLSAQAQPVLANLAPETKQSLVRWATPKRVRNMPRQVVHQLAFTMDRVVAEQARRADRVVCFEFDSVLFRTPSRPEWFPRKGESGQTYISGRSTYDIIIGRVPNRRTSLSHVIVS
jgi:hypothetical protein